MPNSQQRTEEIRSLVAANKIEKAIKLLLGYTAGTDLYEEALMQSSKFQSLRSDKIRGVLDPQDEGVRSARIVNAILEIANSLEEEGNAAEGNLSADESGDNAGHSSGQGLDFHPGWGAGLGSVFVIGTIILAVLLQCPSPFAYEFFKIGIALGAALIGAVIPGFLKIELPQTVSAGGALAVFVMLYFFNPASSIKQDPCGPSDLTILLEDKKGNTPLQNIGQLSLLVGADRRLENINEDGGAIFREISLSSMADSTAINLIADGWQFSNGKNSINISTTQSPVRLLIQRDGSLCCISGTVREEAGGFLPGVKLGIYDTFVISDANGRFRIEVPESRHGDRYRLRAELTGYKIWEKDVYPESEEEVSVILPKN